MNDDPTCGPVDLGGFAGWGPVWGMASEDLNATLLHWQAGGGVAEHVNPDLDVLLVVIAGSGAVDIDGCEHAVRSGQALVLSKGTSRAIRGGPGGLRYLSVHRRRPGLQIELAVRAD